MAFQGDPRRLVLPGRPPRTAAPSLGAGASLRARPGAIPVSPRFRWPVALEQIDRTVCILDRLQREAVAPRLGGLLSSAYLEQAARGDVSWSWTWDAEGRLAAALSSMDGDDPSIGSGLDRSGMEIVLLHDHDRAAGQWRVLVERLLAKGLRFSLPPG